MAMASTATAAQDGAERADTRSRIVGAAAALLRSGGPAAVTTRGVAEAAGVQAPTIYRLFGDKDGLLDAVAEHVMRAFVAAKADVVDAARASDVDPLDDLRAGWRAQVEFGLANPDVFRMLSEPARVVDSPAARLGKEILEARIHRVAATGRLRVTERRAVALVQAGGVGVITTLLATPPEDRDPDLADAVLEAVLAQILTDGPTAAPSSPTDGARGAAVAVRAVAPQLEMLSPGERALLVEWLDRAIDAL
ncbi:TetR/AcrR family transcriptional regulator [Luteimicrobium sp. NPDC057192]|uniref:TetR/AcrR family transcriptional regulator n=1 Tax=Luteimicrobium sp. NPDC057192 TaxID=3346042 RepID=UPI00363DA03A